MRHYLQGLGAPRLFAFALWALFTLDVRTVMRFGLCTTLHVGPRLRPLFLHNRRALLGQYLHRLGTPRLFSLALRALFALKISTVLHRTVLRWTILLHGLSMPLRPRRGALVMTLTDHLVTRLVVIMLVTDHALIFLSRITIAVIVPLVHRQGRGRICHAAIPAIPAVVISRPARAPVQFPARRRIDHPAVKIHWRRYVVTHGHTQHKQRHVVRFDEIPGAVIPGTRIPAIILIHPVQAVIKEIIRLRLRCVIHRVAGYRNEFRIHRLVDPDAHTGNRDIDADLGHGRGRRSEQYRQRNECVAHSCFPAAV